MKVFDICRSGCYYKNDTDLYQCGGSSEKISSFTTAITNKWRRRNSSGKVSNIYAAADILGNMSFIGPFDKDIANIWAPGLGYGIDVDLFEEYLAI